MVNLITDSQTLKWIADISRQRRRLPGHLLITKRRNRIVARIAQTRKEVMLRENLILAGVYACLILLALAVGKTVLWIFR